MESEKVKEIKKALKQNIKTGIGFLDEKEDKMFFVSISDILTLINELESENELLTNKDAMLVKILELTRENEELEKQCVGWVEIYQKKKEENQKLKDRIAELEKELEARKDEVLHLQEYGKKLIRETELKAFCKKFELNIGKHLKKKYSDYEPDSFYFIVDKADIDMCLDETLKELLCEK